MSGRLCFTNTVAPHERRAATDTSITKLNTYVITDFSCTSCQLIVAATTVASLAHSFAPRLLGTARMLSLQSAKQKVLAQVLPMTTENYAIRMQP